MIIVGVDVAQTYDCMALVKLSTETWPWHVQDCRIWRERIGFEAMLDQMAADYGDADQWVIDRTGVGAMPTDYLRTRVKGNVLGVVITCGHSATIHAWEGKETIGRKHLVTGVLTAVEGKHIILDECPGRDEMVQQLVQFGSFPKNDDLVMALALALHYANKHCRDRPSKVKTKEEHEVSERVLAKIRKIRKSVWLKGSP